MTTSAATKSLPGIGSRVRMTSANSNWNVGEIGTVLAHHNGRDLSGIGCDRLSVVLDGREDDYTAFVGDCEIQMKNENYRLYDRTGGGVVQDIYAASLEEAIEEGQEWILDGEWGTYQGELDCEVAEIVRTADGGIDVVATRDGRMHGCSAVRIAPEAVD